MMDSAPFGASSVPPVTDVPWRDWDPELFEDDATAEQLRLLLVAPAWHPGVAELDETLFADRRIVAHLSADLTPIRVDADERPEIAVRYGEPGGVTVSLLSAAGDLLDRFAEPTADTVVAAIGAWLSRWRRERDGVLAELEAERVLRRASLPSPGAVGSMGGDLTPGVLDAVLERTTGAAGPAGPEQVRLWLYAHRRRADLESERRARMAIQRRIDGGGFDEARGGFRHCADPVPACQVRLAEDQGRWLSVLAGIAAEDSDAHEWVLQAVVQTIDFVEAEFLNSSGGFQHAVGDDRVLAASNAALARGLIACGIVFNRPDWRTRGRTAVDFLVRRMRAGEAGFYHGWDGVPIRLGLLGAQISAGQALLDAYELTGSIDYLHQVQTVARLLERQFQTADGLLADTDLGTEQHGLLEEPHHVPADNADGAELLIRLGHLTHDDRYVEMAYAILSALTGRLDALPLESASAVARVVDRLLSIEPEVKIVAFAPPGEIDSVADPLHAEALRLALAAHTVQRLNPEFDAVLVEQLSVPVVAGGAVCFVSGEYGPLLTHPDELLPAIERGMTLPA